MNGEPAISSPAELPTVGPAVLTLQEIGKTSKAWTLTLHPAHLALAESPADRPYVILRKEMMKTAVLMEGMGTFTLDQPRKVMFNLKPADVKVLAEWIGLRSLALFYLRRRFAWILPWAILWAGGSLLALLPQPSGAPTRFDSVDFILGLILIGAWAFARWRPHPVLFLVDSIWFAVVAARLTVHVLDGRSPGWLVLAVLLGWMAVTGLKHFLRFRGLALETGHK